MIKILIAVGLLCAAVFLGPRLADSQGFVHIATEGYIIETSLTTAIIIAFVSFVVLHVLVNIINRSVSLPKSTARWFGKRKIQKQINLQNEAFLAYEEGAYNRALALINKSGNRADLPANCMFLGAKCAFKLGDLDSCRSFLDYAEQSKNCSETACKILRAKLNLKIGNYQAAIENLSLVKKDSYTQGVVTKLLYECYKLAGDDEKIAEILPSLKKLNLVDGQEAGEIVLNFNRSKIDSANSVEELQNIVSKLDRQERQDPTIMAPILSKMVKLGDTSVAGKHALEILRHNVTPTFLESISHWSNAVPLVLEELSKQAQSNKIGSQTNVPMLKALANMEMKSDKLAEAKDHLKQALEVTKDRDLYLLAAELNERLDRYDEATKFFALAFKS